ncbi:hypothetical protein [Christiangramia sp. SM2212]|uniref:Lipocalin-like domain-containing protein n=1 Tax=Christiangramia sediminicola TaxID=3073267 RepID=A0ABU1EQB1_9FLAO|nr:hypothetical protein [Christiangramia sp. SM2212]MDR5590348.1 hypothetical protein [Christiangramia sp. SM2212]
MKRFKIVLAFFTVLTLLSCDADMDDIDLSTAEAQELNVIVKNGEWQVTNFTLNGSDKTATYEDYSFVFEEDNNLSATSTIDQTEGTWRINNDSGSEFDSYDDVDFNIFFTSNSKLGELTRNYDVISATSSEINLILEMDENGDTASLSFSRN